jgi:hypothetical protein
MARKKPGIKKRNYKLAPKVRAAKMARLQAWRDKNRGRYNGYMNAWYAKKRGG